MGGMLEGFSQSPVKETRMATQSFQVTGMTCGHCAGHVTAELKSVAGVSDVTVDLVAGGTSTVHVDASRRWARRHRRRHPRDEGQPKR